jgi:hypothetical protein
MDLIGKGDREGKKEEGNFIVAFMDFRKEQN